MYPECIYYDTKANRWTTDGCEVSLVNYIIRHQLLTLI